jgi:hypothetical protein
MVSEASDCHGREDVTKQLTSQWPGSSAEVLVSFLLFSLLFHSGPSLWDSAIVLRTFRVGLPLS